MHCLRGLFRLFARIVPLSFVGGHEIEPPSFLGVGVGGGGGRGGGLLLWLAAACVGVQAHLAAADIVIKGSCAGRFLGLHGLVY